MFRTRKQSLLGELEPSLRWSAKPPSSGAVLLCRLRRPAASQCGLAALAGCVQRRGCALSSLILWEMRGLVVLAGAALDLFLFSEHGFEVGIDLHERAGLARAVVVGRCDGLGRL